MKLSDALRGAADRAPVDDATISVAAASGRVRRRRAVRAGSTGLVGAGAVAVLAFGAVGQLGPLSSNDADDGFASGDASMESAMDGGAPAMAEEDSAMGGTRLAEQWMCGATFDASDPAWSWGDTSGVAFALGEPAIDGTTLELPHTIEAFRAVDLISSPDALVLWDGIVVGRQVSPSPFEYGPADEPMLPEGEVYERMDPADERGFSELEQSTVMEAVNCWDGEPLPAGTYEVRQAWTLAYPSTADAGAGSGEEPPAEEPADQGAVEPSEMPTEESATDVAPEDALPAPAAGAEVFRVAAGPTTLTIEGEPVDDPFAAYLDGDGPVEPAPLPEPVEPQPLPDGYLTPDLARELFEANRVDGAWDMAAGTQRVVKVNDSRADDPDGDWQENFYGCVWDGSVVGSFPTSSAELDLLDVEVAIPRSISVSYGFVVDDNPLLNSSVRNASAYTIPGFWNGPAPQLFLVRDGVVVAEAYPLGLDDPLAAMERDAAVMDDADDAALTVLPVNEGTLPPGAQVSGRYLWRDVNACGARGEVEPGTYTVLTAQSISLSNEGQVIAYGDGEAGAMGGATEPGILKQEPALELPQEDGALEGSGSSSSSGFADAADPAIAPAPDMEYDWVELHVYTSLGSLTVR